MPTQAHGQQGSSNNGHPEQGPESRQFLSQTKKEKQSKITKHKSAAMFAKFTPYCFGGKARK